VLPPIASYLREQKLERAHILDVGSGTGSLLRQMSAAYPEHRYYGLELSPFYSEFARERLGRSRAVLISDNAECMPFKDQYFDVLTCTHVLHELPRSARGNVLREMRRVLKPGGLLVIEDSVQADADPALKPFLQRFADEFHEPFYRDYLKDDLASALHGAGFAVRSVESHFLAKVAVAHCPSTKRSSRLSRRLD
jgi:ubiquinone/menaquinone biosynthesis C-methylase UbiE